MRKHIRNTAVAASLVGGSLLISTFNPMAGAGAQDSGSTAPTESSSEAPAHLAEGRQGQRRPALRAIGSTAAEVIGIDGRTLLREMREGDLSVAEVATNHGVDPQAVVDAILEKVGAKLDQAVVDGRIDEARAAELEAKAAEKIPQLVDMKPSERPVRAGQAGG